MQLRAEEDGAWVVDEIYEEEVEEVEEVEEEEAKVCNASRLATLRTFAFEVWATKSIFVVGDERSAAERVSESAKRKRDAELAILYITRLDDLQWMIDGRHVLERLGLDKVGIGWSWRNGHVAAGLGVTLFQCTSVFAKPVFSFQFLGFRIFLSGISQRERGNWTTKFYRLITWLFPMGHNILKSIFPFPFEKFQKEKS
jgi:hypothetical protein